MQAKKKRRVSETWDTNKNINTHVMGPSEGKERAGSWGGAPQRNNG